MKKFLLTDLSTSLHDIFKTSEPILMKFKPHIVHINKHKMTYDRIKILIFTIFLAKNSGKNHFFVFFCPSFCYSSININIHRSSCGHSHTESKTLWFFCFRWAVIGFWWRPYTSLLFEELRSAVVFVHKNKKKWTNKMYVF